MKKLCLAVILCLLCSSLFAQVGQGSSDNVFGTSKDNKPTTITPKSADTSNNSSTVKK